MENESLEQEHTQEVPKQGSKALMTVIAIIALALVGYVLFGKGKEGDDDAAADQQASQLENAAPSTADEEATESADEAAAEGDEGAAPVVAAEKSFTVVGENFSFSPNEIRVKKGDKVTITFHNNDGFHDFVLDEFSVKTSQIKSGDETVVEFTADKTGSFVYYCSVGAHRANGMWGTLIVE